MNLNISQVTQLIFKREGADDSVCPHPQLFEIFLRIYNPYIIILLKPNDFISVFVCVDRKIKSNGAYIDHSHL